MEFCFTKLFVHNEHMKWPVNCSIEKEMSYTASQNKL